MASKSLHEWLSYQETLHPENIELGLERVHSVWRKLCESDFSCPLILVAGTNGKGSTVAYLESIYSSAGYSTACYSSPHIKQYNERVRIAGQMVSDQQLIEAFEAVEKARNNIQLTYFEFGTLAALSIFMQCNPDVIILEVGLGGRLDAVNIVPADISIITSITLDHTEWLGDSVDKIAVEKAGIARNSKPLIIGQLQVPPGLIDKATDIGADLYRSGHEFSHSQGAESWRWWMGESCYDPLPFPTMLGNHQLENCAAALCAIELLAETLPVSIKHIHSGLSSIQLAGRYECVADRPSIILDVAHNVAAAAALAKTLEQHPVAGKTHAIFAMQSNRELEPFLQSLIRQVDRWYLCELENGLGHSPEQMRQSIGDIDSAAKIVECCSVTQALEIAAQDTQPDGRIIITGSFYTVAEARKILVDSD